eukprot:SAG25_NODE_594_length_6680_cov_64.843489_4_plen_652_part_00
MYGTVVPRPRPHGAYLPLATSMPRRLPKVPDDYTTNARSLLPNGHGAEAWNATSSEEEEDNVRSLSGGAGGKTRAWSDDDGDDSREEGGAGENEPMGSCMAVPVASPLPATDHVLTATATEEQPPAVPPFAYSHASQVAITLTAPRDLLGIRFESCDAWCGPVVIAVAPATAAAHPDLCVGMHLCSINGVQPLDWLRFDEAMRMLKGASWPLRLVLESDGEGAASLLAGGNDTRRLVSGAERRAEAGRLRRRQEARRAHARQRWMRAAEMGSDLRLHLLQAELRAAHSEQLRCVHDAQQQAEREVGKVRDELRKSDALVRALSMQVAELLDVLHSGRPRSVTGGAADDAEDWLASAPGLLRGSLEEQLRRLGLRVLRQRAEAAGVAHVATLQTDMLVHALVQREMAEVDACAAERKQALASADVAAQRMHSAIKAVPCLPEGVRDLNKAQLRESVDTSAADAPSQAVQVPSPPKKAPQDLHSLAGFQPDSPHVRGYVAQQKTQWEEEQEDWEADLRQQLAEAKARQARDSRGKQALLQLLHHERERHQLVVKQAVSLKRLGVAAMAATAFSHQPKRPPATARGAAKESVAPTDAGSVATEPASALGDLNSWAMVRQNVPYAVHVFAACRARSFTCSLRDSFKSWIEMAAVW